MALLAVPIYQSGTGSIVYGVAPYDGDPVASPSFIPNTFNGLVDILSSPGGGYLTAHPIVANNTAESGTLALPMVSAASGGGNVHGAFGFGITAITGPLVAFALKDINPDGIGAATYVIASWTSTWIENVGYAGPAGAWLAVSGNFTSGVSAGAASLRVQIQGPNLGTVNLDPLILAPRANGPCFGVNGFVDCTPAGFVGAALSKASLFIPAGEVLTVRTTLTLIADPMDFSVFDINSDPALLAKLTSMQGPMPDVLFVAGDPSLIPEPATWAFAALGLVAVLAGRRRR